jgi:hypothetical protein
MKDTFGKITLNKVDFGYFSLYIRPKNILNYRSKLGEILVITVIAAVMTALHLTQN